MKAAREAGLTDEALTPIYQFQKRGQFYLDFIEAENSMGFHAPEEAARILGDSINYIRQGQLALRDLQAGKAVQGPAPAQRPPLVPPSAVVAPSAPNGAAEKKTTN